jgi:hypothetical protein
MSRRLFMDQGSMATSAALLSTCGIGAAASATARAPSKELEDAEVNLLLNPIALSVVTGALASLRVDAAGSLYDTSPRQPASIKGHSEVPLHRFEADELGIASHENERRLPDPPHDWELQRTD